MTVTVRAAGDADAEALAALVVALNAHQGDPTDRFTAKHALADWIERPRDMILRIADADRALVGYATAWPSYESGYAARGFYIADLFVAEPRRREGIGRRLVAAVAAEARRRGANHLWWASQTWNDDAAKFYDRIDANNQQINAHALIQEAFERLADEG